MSQAQLSPDTQARWSVPWVLSIVVTGGAAAFGIYQVGLYFVEAFPASYWSRTLPGILFVPVALSAVVAPAVLAIKKRRFIGLRRKDQWIAMAVTVLVVPGAYLFALAALSNAARDSKPIIAFTPTVTLRYIRQAPALERLQFHFRGLAGGVGGGRWDGTVFAFEETWYERGLLRGESEDKEPDITLEGTLSARPEDHIEIRLQMQAKKPIRLEVVGLGDFQVTRNGEVLPVPVELPAGKHTIEVSGRAR